LPRTSSASNDAAAGDGVYRHRRPRRDPADEFEVFRALVDKGMPIAPFGVTETVVKQQLKLANVSPALLDAYREGEISYVGDTILQLSG
jgi:ParB family chromosome partitioning protein